MNLPNKLTMLRIILIPVFIVFAANDNIPFSYLIAAAVFAVASYTDYLDGKIARRDNLVTDFGKFADPLADKILTTTAFIYMVVDGACSPLVLVIILAREFAVSGVRMVAASSDKGEVIAASFWGKLKTVTQMITIILFYVIAGVAQIGVLPDVVRSLAPAIVKALCWVVAVITAYSGFLYIWDYRHYIDTTK